MSQAPSIGGSAKPIARTLARKHRNAIAVAPKRIANQDIQPTMQLRTLLSIKPKVPHHSRKLSRMNLSRGALVPNETDLLLDRLGETFWEVPQQILSAAKQTMLAKVHAKTSMWALPSGFHADNSILQQLDLIDVGLMPLSGLHACMCALQMPGPACADPGTYQSRFRLKPLALRY
jgi:hypothetical protein